MARRNTYMALAPESPSFDPGHSREGSVQHRIENTIENLTLGLTVTSGRGKHIWETYVIEVDRPGKTRRKDQVEDGRRRKENDE